MERETTLSKALLGIVERFYGAFDGGVDYASNAILIATAGLFVSPTWRKNKGYFMAAVLTGIVFGVVANKTPMLHDFDYILSLAGAITGPATLAAVQHRTIFELITIAKDSIGNAVHKKKDQTSEDAGPPPPPKSDE